METCDYLDRGSDIWVDSAYISAFITDRTYEGTCILVHGYVGGVV